MPAETLSGICPTCGENATFRYIGEQYGHENGVLYLYVCGKCSSTISGRRIVTDEKMAEYLRQSGWTVLEPERKIE